MQVIDIPSSPESSGSPMNRRTRSASRQPGPSQKRRRVAHGPSIVELIELTDSDSDPSVSPFPKTISPQHEPSQPTPSKATNAMPLFGFPNSKLLRDGRASAPGPSQHVQRLEQRENVVPLFLPSNEERVAQVPANQVDSTVAPQLPPLDFTVHHEPVQVDPIDEYTIRVLEIVPDVQPGHVFSLIEQFMRSQPGNVVELVLHTLFEDPSYPKIDRKGKHKRSESDDDLNERGPPKPKVDYTSKERVYKCGPDYFECSLEQLTMDFPRIPKPHIRLRMMENRFYAPTYLLLAGELKKASLPFKLKTSKSAVGKGKARQDPEFAREREWVLLKLAEQAAETDAALAVSINEQEYEDNGESIQCGCCFSGYPFDQMVQCPEAHLFCKSCVTTYASTLLGEHNPNIVCIHQSGCKLPFPESELNRFLPSKLLELYYRVKQRKEIEAAGLENLEECPFCEYKCVIENNMEKLFRCENAGCSAISCRKCKKPDHLPRSCEEAEKDKRLDAQHVIEEAMTQALMRNCPKCQKSFIKETGCNKMTCPHCHTVSCYICRKVITGYDHFSNSASSSQKKKGKCSLWDPIETRHAQEVSEAAKHALAELRNSRPDVDAAQLKVDIPPVPPPPRPGDAPALVGGQVMPPMMGPVAARMIGPVHVGAGNHFVAGMGNPFMFGAGQGHAFLPPMIGGAPPPPFMLGLQPQPVPAVMPGIRARGRRPPQPVVPVPPPAQAVMPGIRARGRRPPQPVVPVPPPAQAPPVAEGGRRGRRRRR